LCFRTSRIPLSSTRATHNLNFRVLDHAAPEDLGHDLISLYCSKQ